MCQESGGGHKIHLPHCQSIISSLLLVLSLPDSTRSKLFAAELQPRVNAQ